MAHGLDGKVAIVTGPGGFGAGYAHAFAGAGAHVVVADIADSGGPIVDSLRAAGHEPFFVDTDVTSEESAQAMAAAVLERYGGADVLVNNAAMFQGLPLPPLDPVEEMPLERWHQVLDMNLTSVLIVTRSVIPLMRARGGGSVVNQTSPAIWANNPGRIHYAVSKGAVLPLTRSLARELGPDHIRVNAIAPGFTTAGDPSEIPDEMVARVTGPMCIKHVGTPADLVGPMLFLAGDMSGWMTGQVLVVDGGAHMLG
jgi:NAD(P)-dependent dehydrogenase (short-subunit alcohol dehydrogenase family)